MNRRGFMASILASATAPYVSTLAGVLMPVKKIFTASWGVSIVSKPEVRAAQREVSVWFRNRLWLANGSTVTFSAPFDESPLVGWSATAPSPAAPAPQSR